MWAALSETGESWQPAGSRPRIQVERRTEREQRWELRDRSGTEAVEVARPAGDSLSMGAVTCTRGIQPLLTCDLVGTVGAGHCVLHFSLPHSLITSWCFPLDGSRQKSEYEGDYNAGERR